MWLFKGFRDTSILLLSHANGLILLGQWNPIWFITLFEQIIDLVLVKLIVFACLRDVLLQSISDIAVKTLDIEVHVVGVVLLQHFVFRHDISIDTQEGGDLIFLDMHEVFVWKILQQNMASVSSVLRQTVKDALLLLNSVLPVIIAISLIVGFFLIFHELIKAILFIVLVGIAIFWNEN